MTRIQLPKAYFTTAINTVHDWSDEQDAIFDWFETGEGNLVVRARAGTGKCLGKDTPILMFDGSIKAVQDVQLGDLLMGPDSRPRKVLSTDRGRGPLCKIVPVKGDSWICNDAHVMTLVGTNWKAGQIQDVPLCTHRMVCGVRGESVDRNWKLLRTGVAFASKTVIVPPYLLGLWLGNGSSAEAIITQVDPEVLDYCCSIARKYGWRFNTWWDEANKTRNLRFTVGPHGQAHRGTPNLLRRFFRKCADHPEGKRIPREYLINDEAVRLELLAGLIDSDGYYDSSGVYEITFKGEALIQDVVFLARSLGFAAYYKQKRATIKSIGFEGYYWRTNISGHLDRIPCRVARKKARPRCQVKNVCRTGFDVIDLDCGDFFGFTLDGDGRFLLGDFTVTHNTTTLIEGINRASEKRILLAAFNKSIADELSARITNHNARAQTLHALGRSFCLRHIPRLEVDTKQERARALAQQAIKQVVGERRGIKAPLSVVRTIADLHTKIREILVDPTAGISLTSMGVLADTRVHDIFEGLEAFAIDFGFDGEDASFWSLSKVVEAALTAVELAKAPTTTIDFADMIFLPLVHGWTEPVCDLLVVDEAQDMTEAQLRLAIAATKPQGRICVCGDDKQAIYGFRGADSGSLDRLKVELQAVELGLKTTYRCPREVVALAREFVSDFRAAPAAPAGEVISLDFMNSTDRLVALAKPGDFVLSRTNAPLVSICLNLIRAGKKAYVKGSEFGREVAKLVDKLIAELPAARLSLPALSTQLDKWSRAECKKLDALSIRAAAVKIAHISDQHELLKVFLEGSKDYRDLREKIEATFADVPNPSAIMCSTVHKAKGLEAPHVFLLGETFGRDNFGEEDNICYVAITRAKETLCIVGKTARQFIMTPEQVRDEILKRYFEE